MSKFFRMEDDLFDVWQDLLIDEAYDWKQIGISNDYCNSISEPKYGLELINWRDHIFCIADEKKYMTFLLKYR